MYSVLYLVHWNHHKVPLTIFLVIFTADFGFARFLEGGVMAETLCGSPMYMVKIVFYRLFFFHLFYFLHVLDASLHCLPFHIISTEHSIITQAASQ